MSFHRHTKIEDIQHFNQYAVDNYTFDGDRYTEEDIKLIRKFVSNSEIFDENERLNAIYTDANIYNILSGNSYYYDEYVLMIAFNIMERKLNERLYKLGHKRDVKKSAYIANNYW